MHAQTVAPTDWNESGKPLSKNPPRTRGVPAEEATDLEMNAHLGPRDGQVGDRPPVGAMYRGGAVPTAWTHRGTPPGPEVEMPDAFYPMMCQEEKRGQVR